MQKTPKDLAYLQERYQKVVLLSDQMDQNDASVREQALASTGESMSERLLGMLNGLRT